MKRLASLIKVVVSFGLIAYLLYIVDIQKTLWVLRSSQYAYIILAVALYLATFLITSLRWQVLLRVHNIRLPFRSSLVFYLIGFFFNNFLPTSIGGDVARIYHSARASGRKAECASAVLIERIIGFIAIILLAVLGLFRAADRLRNPALLYVAVLLLCFLLGSLLLLTRRRGLALLEKLTGRITWKGIAGRCQKLFTVFRLYRNRWEALGMVLGLSVVFQGVMVVAAYYVSQAIGLGVGLPDFFVCVPVVAVLGMLPSINGLGVREGGYVYLFTQLGTTAGSAVDKSAAFSFTILILGITIFTSLIGGMLFLAGKGSGGGKRIKEIIAEDAQENTAEPIRDSDLQT